MNISKKIIGGLFLSIGFLLSPLAASAATLSLSPATKNINVGDIVSVRMNLNAESTAINNAEAVVSFPTDILEVLSVSKSGSIFSLWLSEPAFSNAAGTVSFNGGLPNPGFSGSGGTTLTMTFRAKRAGTATLSIGDAAVRANDGLGTDVLHAHTGAVFTVTSVIAPSTPVPTAVQPAPTSGTGGLVAPVISSATHPDQTAWYKDTAPALSWTLPTGVSSVQTVLSADKNAVPSVTYTSALSEKKLEALSEGTSYFRVRYKSGGVWSAVGTYTFNIDTTPPDISSHDFTYDDTQHAISVSVVARDAHSGIAGYTLTLDGGKPVVVPLDAFSASRYMLKVNGAGLHTVVLTAQDAAGNESSVSGTFSVPESLQNAPLFTVAGIPVTLPQVIFILLLLIMVTFGVALLGWYRLFLYRQHLRGNVQKTAADMHRGFTVLKSDIEKHLKAMERAKTKRELTKEEEDFRREMTENLGDFEEYVDKDLAKIAPLRKRKNLS